LPIRCRPPLAAANDGKLICVEPQPETKTCNELIRYTVGDDGIVQAHTIGALDEDALVIWEGSAPVEIKGGQICDRSRPEDLKHHQVRIQPGTKGLPNAETYKAFLYATVTAMQHHDLCIDFVPDASGVLLKYIFNGAQSTMPDERAIWVSAEDGYKVGW
jgi:hypothetical protein